MVFMRKLLLVAALFTLLASMGMTQDENKTTPAQTPSQSAATIKEFTRTAKGDGLTLKFVLLNNKTVDLLFTGDSIYTMRAKANLATVFFVQGISEKDIILKPSFEVVQDGKTFPCESVNLKNLEAGPLAKGTRFSGLVQLSEKIDVAQPFVIKGASISSAGFKLSKTAIKLLEN